MLFEILGTFAGYYTRKWKKIAIILGMAFFFGLIGGFINVYASQPQYEWLKLVTFIIVPIPVNLFFEPYFFMGILISAILSVTFTFVYYLIGKSAKKLLNLRGL